MKKACLTVSINVRHFRVLFLLHDFGCKPYRVPHVPSLDRRRGHACGQSEIGDLCYHRTIRRNRGQLYRSVSKHATTDEQNGSMRELTRTLGDFRSLWTMGGVALCRNFIPSAMSRAMRSRRGHDMSSGWPVRALTKSWRLPWHGKRLSTTQQTSPDAGGECSPQAGIQ